MTIDSTFSVETELLLEGEQRLACWPTLEPLCSDVEDDDDDDDLYGDDDLGELDEDDDEDLDDEDLDSELDSLTPTPGVTDPRDVGAILIR